MAVTKLVQWPVATEESARGFRHPIGSNQIDRHVAL